MSRQPTTPVVRPLPVVSSYINLREFILSRPADSSGMHIAYCVLSTFPVSTSEGEITPLVGISIVDLSISMYIQICSEAEPYVYLKDASEVTTSVLCGAIPCSAGSALLDEVIDYLRDVVDGMASDGYEVREILVEVDGYPADARIDVLVDI